jgi:hypothetical protein
MAYSESMTAGWMFVPDEPEEVLIIIRSHCDEVNG